MKKLNWGILGTGWIAHEMAAALNAVNGEIYAVCDTSLEAAQKFADEFSVQNAYASADLMIADPAIDIVYIATPHSLHYKFLLQSLQAGKHVFCEKSITVNSQQLEECVAVAKEKGLVISDGVTLLHMPLYKKLAEIVASGAIGQVKMVQVNFGSCKEYDVTNRFFSKELAGGALLDIGVYATSFARFFMKSRANQVLTTANFFETGVDETSGIILKNPEGEMAVMALTMRAKQPKRGVVAGEKGYIEIEEYPRASKATITYTEDGRKEVIEAGESDLALQYEVADMQDYVLTNGGQENLDIIRDVMASLTEVRKQWGMVYPFE
ncbi:oxidoreductase [Streptococcus penaeicida]|uniref:Oxidoreductase n=1 Tax=Streptococcus penaeicida TaxID=1765960 RepID=A0A2N8LAV1_9STRE|nr:Gfo/Idh/MocA family oxidoreductase [Streptococcus penaeicida]PND47286.1 oxidoreductase [Streptococcus penaeicida]